MAKPQWVIEKEQRQKAKGQKQPQNQQKRAEHRAPVGDNDPRSRLKLMYMPNEIDALVTPSGRILDGAFTEDDIVTAGGDLNYLLASNLVVSLGYQDPNTYGKQSQRPSDTQPEHGRRPNVFNTQYPTTTMG